MRSLKKRKNYKSEEHFHDEWALSTPISEIDAIAPFEGVTSPEYAYVMEAAGDVKDKYVLNLGCGLGEEAIYLAKKGARVVAIDISPGMIEVTKKVAKKYNVEKKISYAVMAAEDLKYKPNTFDVVVGANILHHIDLVTSVSEIKRVLKPGGIAVFTEPFAYNPIVNIYRSMASNVRTDHEHPLTYEDFNKIKKIFPLFTHKEFHLFTLLIFVWFYVVERLHPNDVRYWKKIIKDGPKYAKAFSFLYAIDKFFLRIFPFLNKYCWVTVVKFQKESREIFEESYFKGWYKSAVGSFGEDDIEIARNWFWSWLKVIDRYIPFKDGKNKKILEIGCSIGAVANLLVERGFSVWATDISRFAVKNAKKLTPGAHFSVLDAQEKIRLNTTFDYVLSFEVVEHLAEPEKAIKNMYDVLKKGGYVIISTPYPYSWNFHDPTHINVKYPKEWVKILQKAGFKQVSYHPFTLVPFFYRYNKHFQIILPFHLPIPNVNTPIIFIGKK